MSPALLRLLAAGLTAAPAELDQIELAGVKEAQAVVDRLLSAGGA